MMKKRMLYSKVEDFLLDDDFRLSQHGANRFFCACPRHLERLSAQLGKKIAFEDLKDLFVGKPSKIRSAWLKVMGESLYEAAGEFRAAADEVDEKIPLAICAVYSHLGVDGVDLEKLTAILAGKGKKLLRLHGAPYWACKNGHSPVSVTEVARMFASVVKNKEIETMAEGDVYPRPRYNVPSSLLELFDAAIRFDGNCDGILKYIVDYTANVDFETGYAAHHVMNIEKAKKASELFGKRANCGVSVFTKANYLGGADISPNAHLFRQPYPEAGVLLGSCGIPTVHFPGGGYCTALFGDLADVYDRDIGPGLILDSRAAEKLEKKGIDVGLKAINTQEEKTITFLVNPASSNHAACWNSKAVIADAVLKEGAKPVLNCICDEKEKVFAYRYENARRQRFFVYLIEYAAVDKDSGLYRNYEQQSALYGAVEWIAKKPLPIKMPKNPNLYIMCAKDEGSLSAALINFSPDPVLQPKAALDRKYSRAECVGCEVKLEGASLTLASPLPAYEYALVKLFV